MCKPESAVGFSEAEVGEQTLRCNLHSIAVLDDLTTHLAEIGCIRLN